MCVCLRCNEIVLVANFPKKKMRNMLNANVDRWLSHTHTHKHHAQKGERVESVRTLLRFLWKPFSYFIRFLCCCFLCVYSFHLYVPVEIRYTFRFYIEYAIHCTKRDADEANAIRRNHRRKGQMKYFKCVVFIKGRRYNLSRLAHIWDTFTIAERRCCC